ncbi:hypothetical protein [Streptococcus hillyeri]|uniref:Phage encoded ArpU family transcriptional regulator n=1 Tax=Streptococcus hillyeri TaxID=2282420 RepID=A0A3L9DX81_9STRE|nr:hypothetical protein [Streptococcus hillyeri]RLY03400.1 hypothetical protein EAF07_05075 [Streptococcus hillyeri]
MEKRQLKELARRKLSEFHKWRNVAGFHYSLISVSDVWTVELFDFKPEEFEMMRHDWQREAPYEVNEIIKAINAIEIPRRRATLVLSYLMPQRLGTKEQKSILSVASSTYHRDKELALLDFAKLYRNGVIKTFTEQD